MMLALLMQISLVSTLGAYTECYSELLGVNRTWGLQVKFDSLPMDWIAATKADPSYYEATITYDTTSISRLVLKHQEAGMASREYLLRLIVIHELWHVLLWELGELALKYDEEWAARLEEQLTTRIQRMGLWHALCVGTP